MYVFQTMHGKNGLSSLPQDEAILRKRIQELQHYRRMGLTTAADIEKYEVDNNKRVCRQISPDERVFSMILSFDTDTSKSQSFSARLLFLREAAVTSRWTPIIRSRSLPCKLGFCRW
jgi:hypothetical protein